MAIVAVLGASFSLREDEPNPCNVRLAKEVERISDNLVSNGHLPVVVVQWEIDLALRRLGADVVNWDYKVIGPFDTDEYLGTEELITEASSFFQSFGATKFVAVANPFIHQQYVYFLARKHFKLMLRRVRWIGFDKQSSQWWCRSWWQFLYQTARLAMGASHGYDGKQAKA